MLHAVTIIIPSYNSAAFIEDAISSALAQTYSHTEIIVIDDGSTDRTLDIIRSFGDRIRYETQPNQGAPVARNRGLALAKGDYVKFLDADDVLQPDCIERQIQQAQQLPKDRKAIVYGDAQWVNEHQQPVPGYSLRSRQPSEDPIAHILTACPLTSCPLHKREYLQEVGGFDPTLPRGQEHDLHLRLALSRVEFVYHPGIVYDYRNYTSKGRISGSSLSSKGALVEYGILQKQQALIEKQMGQPLPESIRQAIAKRYWQFGRGVLREGHSAAAAQYFQAARSLSQRCVVGASPYPQLVQWFGPYRAESVLTRVKELKAMWAKD